MRAQHEKHHLSSHLAVVKRPRCVLDHLFIGLALHLMKQLCVCMLALLSLSGMAQKEYGPTNDSLYLGFYRDSIAQLERPTIVIVPFHPDKYMSEIDHYIAQGTNYNYQHTRGFFRKGLDNSMLIAAKPHNEYVSMHADDPVINQDLYFIYRVVGVSVVPYEPPVIADDKDFKKRLADYWVKLQTNIDPQPEPGARIEKGEVVSVRDTRELIAKARIVNPLVFDSLTPKYNADYFIFVNELDMLNAAQSQTQYEQDDYARVIKVHYSVYDAEGTELFSLVKKRHFPSYQNDLPTIIKEEYLPMGHEVIYSLDSYRFLQAGLTPIQREEEDKKSVGLNLPEFRTLRKK